MKHIGEIIKEELHRQGRSVTWLARQLYCDRTNVYNIFKRQSIDTETLLRISSVLDHDFFCYYRQRLENGEMPAPPLKHRDRSA